MSAPLRAVLAPPVATSTAKWPKDFVSAEDRTDPYKQIGLHRLSVRDELERAADLLEKAGYQIIPRVRK